MKVFEPGELVAGLKRVEIDAAERAEIICALEGLRRVRARADAAEVALGRRLHDLTPFADRDVSSAAQRSARHGDRVRERVDTAAAVPAMGDAFSAGVLSGEHVDAVSKALRAAPAKVRDALAAKAGELAPVAVGSGLSPDEFADRLRVESDRLEADDGMARFERQRRATRFRTWTDRRDGMFRVSGAFDPLSGAMLHGRLQSAMAAMFAKEVPAVAPDDPGERQDFLRGLALLALTARCKPDPEGAQRTGSVVGDVVNGPDGRERSDAGVDANVEWVPYGPSGRPMVGRPELVVVIDTTVLDEKGRPTVDWGIPVSVPYAVVVDLARRSSVHAVLVDGDGGVSTAGVLDLGRTTRLANRAQRRALRALYPTCSVPGCGVRFELTKLHHVVPWCAGGRTDLNNLLPVCNGHHDCAHHGGWKFTLGPQRVLTISFPDGRTLTTGPPKRTTTAVLGVKRE